MTISVNDLSFALSGGLNNFNANNSIGGPESSHSVGIGKNNLFDDVTNNEAEDGLEDYRCIYIFNDSPTDIIYNLTVSFASQVEGTNVEMGVLEKEEFQTISIQGTTTGGTFDLTYDDNLPLTINYSHSSITWASNIRTALRTINGLEEVIVGVLLHSPTNTIFSIGFSGTSTNRSHPALVIDDNSLTGSGTITINVSRLTEGSPVNTIAEQLGSSIQTPLDIEFGNSVLIPRLDPTDGFPIWFKRTVPKNTSRISPDGFTLNIVFGSSITAPVGAFSIEWEGSFDT
jgi:hypothetical protein